ncbi:ATP-binding cassette domain-containing protein [Streptomyces sp. NPDC055078]
MGRTATSPYRHIAVPRFSVRVWERARVAAQVLTLPSARRESRELRDEALGLLDFVGLAADAHRPAGLLPHGRQRLMEIARGLMAHPRLLLMDEPAAGYGTSAWRWERGRSARSWAPTARASRRSCPVYRV